MSWVMLLGSTALAGLSSTYFMFPHVQSRVDRFFSPEKADTHQVDAAAIAQAAGGLFGRGPGEGVMKRRVPDLHTDFAASVAAEEYVVARRTGAFLLVDAHDGMTLAAGMVGAPLSAARCPGARPVQYAI